MSFKEAAVASLKERIATFTEYERLHEIEERDFPNKYPKKYTSGYTHLIVTYTEILKALQKGTGMDAHKAYAVDKVEVLTEWVKDPARGEIYLPMLIWYQRLLLAFIMEEGR